MTSFLISSIYVIIYEYFQMSTVGKAVSAMDPCAMSLTGDHLTDEQSAVTLIQLSQGGPATDPTPCLNQALS